MLGIVGFCGASQSGKTTLASGVIAQLRDRGLKVGVIKHHGHAQPLALAPGQEKKDTTLLLGAGAARAILVHAGGVVLTTGPAEAEATPAQIAACYLADLDLVLVEGFKQADIDKIEVVAPGREPLRPGGGRLIALARRGGAGQEGGVPVLDADDPAAVADFVLQHLAGLAPDQPRVLLKVDGRHLAVNPFVAALLNNTLRGLVNNLKGGEQAGRIEVELA